MDLKNKPMEKKKEDPCLKIPKNKMEREKKIMWKKYFKKKSFLKERPQKSSDSQVLISKSFSLDP